MSPPPLFFGFLDQYDELSLASNSESSPPLELEPVRQRRTRIPDKPNYYLNLWSIMKNCIGKELSKIPMPVRSSKKCWIFNFFLPKWSKTKLFPCCLAFPGELQRAAVDASASVWRPRVLRAPGQSRKVSELFRADVLRGGFHRLVLLHYGPPHREALQPLTGGNLWAGPDSRVRLPLALWTGLQKIYVHTWAVCLDQAGFCFQLWRNEWLNVFHPPQVSHHPPAAAHHAFSEKGWTLRQEITLASKFRGKYLSIMPLGKFSAVCIVVV